MCLNYLIMQLCSSPAANKENAGIEHPLSLLTHITPSPLPPSQAGNVEACRLLVAAGVSVNAMNQITGECGVRSEG